MSVIFPFAVQKAQEQRKSITRENTRRIIVATQQAIFIKISIYKISHQYGVCESSTRNVASCHVAAYSLSILTVCFMLFVADRKGKDARKQLFYD